METMPSMIAVRRLLYFAVEKFRWHLSFFTFSFQIIQIHGGSTNIAATFIIPIRIPDFISFLLSIGF